LGFLFNISVQSTSGHFLLDVLNLIRNIVLSIHPVTALAFCHN
jgi:hypothetical protein